MKNSLGFVSFVLIIGGLSGLLSDHLWGLRLFGFVRYLVPDGHQTLGYCVMIGTGVLLAIGTGLLDRLGGED
ncbi:hypothetical protein ACFCX4_03275 [Kitasatospora sp. NPDC056327]|uniref:hypothetical protein n=1 Tax=Kitasatospora sp. NPDC056327 TaxID=3345785 RepID=UPI0035D5CA51